MLKFQDDYTTIITTFEDFILLVYTIIDDLYHQFVPSSVSQRVNLYAIICLMYNLNSKD